MPSTPHILPVFNLVVRYRTTVRLPTHQWSDAVTIGDHLHILRNENMRIADIGEAADLATPIPTCPPWVLEDLLRHVGTVHRLCHQVVSGALKRPPAIIDCGQLTVDGHYSPLRDTGKFSPDIITPDAIAAHELPTWIRDSNRLAIEALDKAPANLQCWQYFTTHSPFEFWLRQQVHETTLHRVDAQIAVNSGVSAIHPLYAVEGIDHLLEGFHSRADSPLRSHIPMLLLFQATDMPPTRGDWYVELSASAPRVTSQHDATPTCTVRGPAELLFLALWNRIPFSELAVTGPAYPLQLWKQLSPVRWTDFLKSP